MNFSIRDSKGNREGPGGNVFKPENVSLGKEIVLKIGEDGTCAEIFSKYITYGKWTFDIKKPFLLPRGIILGIFLYEDDTHEYDIEFGRWNIPIFPDCQFVNQPHFPRKFFNLKKQERVSITYKKDEILLQVGKRIKSYPNNLTKPRLHINLWAYGKPKPCSVSITEVKE